MSKDILVFVEQRDGVLENVGFELLGEARRLADKVEGAKVVAKVVAQGKAPKIIVYKYKSKKNYHKKQGHRQPFTKVQITKIEA